MLTKKIQLYIMNKSMLRILYILTLALFLINCKKKAYDDYYGRPENLAPPIYQQLEKKGNFKTLIGLIDKSGYKSSLGAAGYWTFFAPNDAAFTKFFQDRNISGPESVDSTTSRAIVQYLLVYNAFDSATIDDFQSSAGWTRDVAFRRRTAYYTGFYDDTTQSGQVVKAIQSNRNGATAFVSGDNGNKYIPYFTNTYLRGQGITSADYNYFYPTSEFNGFNVAQAKVLNANNAENGIFYEIDKVVTPLPSIDEYLRSKPEYSEFKKLYDKYMVSFILNADAGRRYQLLTGESKQVFVKTYSNLLAYSLNNENYLKLQDNDAQQNAWTIFAPKNDVLLNYVNTVILEHYKSFENAPSQILADFLNAHMWLSPVWPSKFGTSSSSLGEEARFNAQTDVFDKKILSNAIFYGTNKVQEANVFSTVYARAYLDPKFSIMTRLLGAELRFIVTDPRQKFTLFMIPDAVLRAAGYDFNTNSNTYTFTPGGAASPASETVRQTLLRILHTGLIYGEKTSLIAPGIAEAYNNEFLKFNNNQVITAGTQDAGRVVMVDSTRTTLNGTVYYLNGLLTFTTVNIGTHIRNLGGATPAASDYNYFANFLISSASMYAANTGEITGTIPGGFYTVLAPSNAAIIQAVKDGLLPGNTTTGIPNFGTTTATAHTAAQRLQVEKFIQYHIVNRKTIVPDGVTKEPVETLLKNALGEVIPVTIFNTPGNMQITDANGRKANVIIAKSNNLSNRAVIHLIDNYLKY